MMSGMKITARLVGIDTLRRPLGCWATSSSCSWGDTRLGDDILAAFDINPPGFCQLNLASAAPDQLDAVIARSEEHTSELTSLITNFVPTQRSSVLVQFAFDFRIKVFEVPYPVGYENDGQTGWQRYPGAALRLVGYFDQVFVGRYAPRRRYFGSVRNKPPRLRSAQPCECCAGTA